MSELADAYDVYKKRQRERDYEVEVLSAKQEGVQQAATALAALVSEIDVPVWVGFPFTVWVVKNGHSIIRVYAMEEMKP